MTKHGLKLILYLNEPRGMPDAFFKMHPDWRGVKAERSDRYALCTSNPDVLEKLSKGVETLFRKVPELGGLFCITMSENLTNCFSKGCSDPAQFCPRCAKRTAPEVIVKCWRPLNAGRTEKKADAEVIAWSWAWSPDWDEDVIARLPSGVKLMMVSESHLETDCCGGIKGKVIDYSISKPGPGPTFARLANKARKAKIPIIAKVQLNNTWENSAVPYIPVPGLVQEHLDNLRALGVKDFMVSWTLSGYSGGNIPLLDKSKEELAKERFGSAASEILKACSFFDKGFRFFPFNHPQIKSAQKIRTTGSICCLKERKPGMRRHWLASPMMICTLGGIFGFYPEDRFRGCFCPFGRNLADRFEFSENGRCQVPVINRQITGNLLV